MGGGVALALAVGGWAWHRWKKARKRVFDPILIKENVSRIAFDAEIQVTAILPGAPGPTGRMSCWSRWPPPTATMTTPRARAST